MSQSKAQLQNEAKSLGLSSNGTVGDLQRRIQGHKDNLQRQYKIAQQAQARQQANAEDEDVWESAGSFDDHFEQQPTETLPRHTAIGPAMGVAALVYALFS
jgi:hypothetical protein